MFIKRGLGEIISVIEDEESLKEAEKIVSKDAAKQVKAQIDKDKASHSTVSSTKSDGKLEN